ncbi:IclR family transcriptional regulator [Actinoplanes sp. NPDC051475]|uniref:IclR family transcriptional regulator n=1 Tax=Actinoplanes sp. NPDC051475 TaxID=3157225 RepID=UPI00344BF395
MSDPPVGILARSAAVTELLAREGPLTPADISDRTGMPRASVYRLVDALGTIGLTEPRSGGQVALSLRWLRLGDAASAALQEWAGADAVLQDLARRTGQTAYLSVPRGDEALCIRWAQGSGIGVLVLRPGRSLPLHAGAAGRLCLAYRGDLAGLLARAPFPRLTPRTLTTAEELLADVAETRARGYSISDQDVTQGIGALGAAVLDGNDELAAAVSIGGLAVDVDRDRLRFAGVLADAAAQLSAGLRR